MRFEPYEEKQIGFYLTLELNGHNYIYVYDDDNIGKMIMKILKDAANPDLNINVYYARLLIERLKELPHGEKERSQIDNEPHRGDERDQQRY